MKQRWQGGTKEVIRLGGGGGGGGGEREREREREIDKKGKCGRKGELG